MIISSTCAFSVFISPTQRMGSRDFSSSVTPAASIMRGSMASIRSRAARSTPQQVRVQLFAQNQAAVKGGPVFLQIALLHTAILADGDLRLFRKFQVGGLIPAAGVSQFVSSGSQRDSIEFDPCIG